uniref:Alternative protein SLC6A19 n=1 Tax=Homo sapiens TaxID=9606 RepID=L8E8F7_HUMAN|nr:alternative protein SLC6A19 [Homo sapiens]
MLVCECVYCTRMCHVCRYVSCVHVHAWALCECARVCTHIHVCGCVYCMCMCHVCRCVMLCVCMYMYGHCVSVQVCMHIHVCDICCPCVCMYI